MDFILNIKDIKLVFDMQKQFELPYYYTRFFKYNAIFIRFSILIFSNFNNIIQLAKNIKQNSILLKEIIIRCISNYKYIL